jgi:hypothetical protein
MELVCTLEGYWKPCYGNAGSSETYLSEVAAFHLDRIVGFHRCPAVVPRYFTIQEMTDLAEKRLVCMHRSDNDGSLISVVVVVVVVVCCWLQCIDAFDATLARRKSKALHNKTMKPKLWTI